MQKQTKKKKKKSMRILMLVLMLGLELVTSKRPEPYFCRRRFYLAPLQNWILLHENSKIEIVT